MLSKALVATDLSEASDHVLGCLPFLRALGTTEVLLVHVIYIRLRYPETGGRDEALIRAATPRLAEQSAALEAAGFKVRTLMPVGVPYLEINRLSQEEDVSLIVVGSHGESMAQEVLLGSVSSGVIHHAVRPVLVVRLKIAEEDGGKRCEVACSDFLRHILYPTDFSDTAEQAFRYVERMVERGCQRVTLLHVQDKVKIGKHLEDRLQEFNQIDWGRLQRLQERLEAKGAANVRKEVPYGYPTAVILESAGSSDYSLIVMGGQGRGFIEEVFLGSVAHNVVRHAPIPVLLIPALR
jgi:nucleotide-binding universal stress UspA family protein